MNGFTDQEVTDLKARFLDNFDPSNLHVGIIAALKACITGSKSPTKCDENKFYKLYMPDEGYLFIKYIHKGSSTHTCIELWLPAGDSSRGRKDSEGCVRDTQIKFPSNFRLGMVIDKLIEKCIICKSDII